MTVLCRLDDLADPGSKAFTLRDIDGDEQEIFVVRQGARVFGYVNSCPHLRIPLALRPDRYLDYDKAHIQCATHGALFRIKDGKCIQGPCRGKSLRQVALDLVEGEIRLA